MSILKIKAALDAEGIMSPIGKSIWSRRTINMILSNKKYCGLSVVKAGVRSYECLDHHEPIITPELFERTQTAKAERTNIEIGEDGRKLRRRTRFTSLRMCIRNVNLIQPHGGRQGVAFWA